MADSRPVRVRFAPSPTGDMHIGGGRTALFNWLFAHHFEGGKFILRIEDTDQKRTQENSLTGIMEGLKWLGLTWDEGPDVGGPFGPYVQSERLELYQTWAQWLIDNGKAYKAFETSEELELINKVNKNRGYDRRGRKLTAEDWARLEAEGKKYVVRFKIPDLESSTTVIDMARGPITVQNDQLQDLVLLKSDGFPTYHLANVIDDHFMEISHILRAEEWIPSAPIHKLLYAAFGWDMPQLAHVPVILKIEGQGKMSKRDKGAKMSEYIEGGYIPEAVVNYLCNVGWNYGVMDEKGEEVQVFTKEEAAKVFDVARVTTNPTKFDFVKLKWLNGEYIRRLDHVELAKRVRPFLEKAGLEVNLDVLLKIIPLIRERMQLLTEGVDVAGFFFKDTIATTREALIPKKLTADDARKALQAAYDAIQALPEFTVPAQEVALRPLVTALGLKAGDFFGTIRVAVTGQTVSPPLFETLEVVGREVTLSRLAAAIKLLS
jgi:glutamyl-tRNA synthetase